MPKLSFIFWLLILLANAMNAQRRGNLTARARSITTPTTAPSTDYSDYDDGSQTAAATTTRSPSRSTTTRAVAAWVNARIAASPMTKTSKVPRGSTVSAASSNRAQLTGSLSGPSQDPWAALDKIRGKPVMSADEVMDLMFSARPGVDFPILGEVPDAVSFQCVNQKMPGFYADPDFKCQVFRRCDPNGNLFSFLCPNTTVFNQVTLTCDYWFNVDCAKSVGFYDFSNARLYHDNWPLLGSISAN